MPDRLTNLFPTTLMRRSLEGASEINAPMQALIREIAATEPNRTDGKSTEGGYQTAEDFFERRHPAIVALKGHVENAVKDYAAIMIRQDCYRPPTKVQIGIWGWAVILKAGDGQGIHVHPAAQISGVYYVAVPPGISGANADDGRISFHDPRPRANMSQLAFRTTRHRETPAAGDMILFPSWLEHSVFRFQGPGDRICIAFNAALSLE